MNSLNDLMPHLLVLGQSNVANHGATFGHSLFGRVHFAGEYTPLQDPIPGGSGDKGSVWTRFAPLAQSRLCWRDLTISMLAQGGASVADWSQDGGKYNRLLVENLEQLGGVDPSVSHVIWHQGERDTLLQTTADEYKKQFAQLHALVTKALGNVVWIICQASYRMGVKSEAATTAQRQIADTLPNCFAGPNTDLLGADMRYDNTHFNERGLDAFATGLCDTFADLAQGKP